MGRRAQQAGWAGDGKEAASASHRQKHASCSPPTCPPHLPVNGGEGM